MSRLGTWTTIDCPTKKIDEAEKFLSDEFEKINGYVRRKENPHDFGTYPSFEVDLPYELDDIIDPDCCCGECEECEEALKLSDWQDKANAIETAYSEKFSKYL